MYLITFLDFLSPSSFIPPQNVVYFLMSLFLAHKIFKFYINGVLNCKCPAPGPKGYGCPISCYRSDVYLWSSSLLTLRITHIYIAERRHL